MAIGIRGIAILILPAFGLGGSGTRPCWGGETTGEGENIRLLRARILLVPGADSLSPRSESEGFSVGSHVGIECRGLVLGRHGGSASLSVDEGDELGVVAVGDPFAPDSGFGRDAGHPPSLRSGHVAVAPEPEAALALEDFVALGFEGRLEDLLGLGHRGLLRLFAFAWSHTRSVPARLQVERPEVEGHGERAVRAAERARIGFVGNQPTGGDRRHGEPVSRSRGLATAGAPARFGPGKNRHYGQIVSSYRPVSTGAERW